jgi:hypothetical protein
MTAKEKQAQFVKTYLKPTLKYFGYQTSGQTWWKDKGEFFNVINLQNYSWNTKNNIDFRFNIGVALKATVKDDQKKKATLYDLTTHLSEGTFLPIGKKRKFGNNQGYSITDTTDLDEFIDAIKSDFEAYILPALEEPNSLTECIKFYDRFPFWGDKLKRIITEKKLLLL